MIAEINNAYETEYVRAIERDNRDANSDLSYGLMQKAGKSLAGLLLENVRLYGFTRIAVVCGPGNNGGDGYEAAVHLLKKNLEVVCIAYRLPRKNTEAYAAYSTYLSAGGRVSEDLDELKNGNYEVVVDALLGIGLSSEVREKMSQWISVINHYHAYKIAVDIPSGLYSDSGQVAGCAVKCDETVTFVVPKIGLFVGAARDYTGRISYDNLDLNIDGYRFERCFRIVTYDDLACVLPRRLKSGNKSDSGKIALIGGAKDMPGAIRFAAKAALRTGAGLVRVASCSENLPIIAGDTPEFMLFNLDKTEEPDIRSLQDWADALVIGPGLGRTGWSERIWNKFKYMEKPMVIDADGLFHLARDIARNESFNYPKSVITPHEGEAARLLGESIEYVKNNRFETLVRLQKLTNGTVVLKGAGTLVYDGCGMWLVNNGCEGMSVGGMGDLLAGIIGALMAFGFNSADAARLGTALHGRAGELAGADGMIGMLPSDLLPLIRRLINHIC